MRSFAEAFQALKLPLHVLLCNAGRFPSGYAESADGIELTFAVCHLGHFLLAELLQPQLTKGGEALSSSAPSSFSSFSNSSNPEPAAGTNNTARVVVVALT